MRDKLIDCLFVVMSSGRKIGLMGWMYRNDGCLVCPRRGYIFEVKSSDGPGLNFPQLSDPSGLYIRRDGLLGHYLVGCHTGTNKTVFSSAS